MKDCKAAFVNFAKQEFLEFKFAKCKT